MTIPYYPLSPEMLAGIVRLQLGRIGKRIEENHAPSSSPIRARSITSSRCATIPTPAAA